jgi:capsular polysaccharide biosynthesis protein/Mrp family chromosome partitioning ATPase
VKELIDDGLSVKDYVRILFKRKGILLVIFFGMVFASTGYSYLVLPKYEATSKILLESQKEIEKPLSKQLSMMRLGVQFSATQAEMFRSKTLISQVVKTLDLDNRPDPEGLRGAIYVWLEDLFEKMQNLKTEIKGKIISLFTGSSPAPAIKATDFEKAVKQLSSDKVLKIEPLERTDVISIMAIDRDPEMATRIANAFSQAYIIYKIKLDLAELQELYRDKHPHVVRVMNELKRAEAKLKTGEIKGLENLNDDTSIGDAKILQLATVPTKPVFPKKMINIITAMFLGAGLGIGYVFLLEAINQSIKTPKDVRDVLGVNFVGTIPFSDIPVSDRIFYDTGSTVGGKSSRKKGARIMAYWSSLRSIASQFHLKKQKENISIIMMVSATPKEGKSILSLGLASALSRITGERTLVVDANTIAPNIHKLAGLNNRTDFNYTNGSGVAIEDVVQPIPDGALDVVYLGKPAMHPEELFTSKEVKSFFEEAKKKYGFIIVDTPCLNEHKDALSLASVVDGVLFTVKSESTSKFVAGAAETALIENDIPIVGAVLNFRRFMIPKSVYRRL